MWSLWGSILENSILRCSPRQLQIHLKENLQTLQGHCHYFSFKPTVPLLSHFHFRHNVDTFIHSTIISSPLYSHWYENQDHHQSLARIFYIFIFLPLSKPPQLVWINTVFRGGKWYISKCTFGTINIQFLEFLRGT